MTLNVFARAGQPSGRDRMLKPRLRPGLEGMEERIVPSTMAPDFFRQQPVAVATHHVVHVSSHHQVTVRATGEARIHAGATAYLHAARLKHPAHRLAHRKGHHAAPTTSTPTPTTAPAATKAAPAPAATAAATEVLDLNVAPIDLNLLGLEVRLYGQDASSPVNVKISAQPGSGALLGNLLSDVAGLLNLQGVNNTLNTVLTNVITLVNQSSLSVTGVPSPTTTATATTPVLDAFVAPVHLDLLGAVVDTSPIHLQIIAHSGSGYVLGNILTDLANLLNTPPPNGKLTLKYVETQLQTLLNQLDAQLPNIPSAPTTPITTTAGSDQILSLNLPPINLNLLGLILKTSAIQVNATAQSGDGQLLGNLLVDVLNTLDASQQDLTTINNELNSLLAKVVGVLNATSLSLPTGAVAGLSPTLQQLTDPTLINTTGAAVPPQSILNLIVASPDGGPPVDVNLLGVVVTTSNIQAQLLAQPGDGQVLGNLLYNVSHLLDPGGALGVLSILNVLGL